MVAIPFSSLDTGLISARIHIAGFPRTSPSGLASLSFEHFCLGGLIHFLVASSQVIVGFKPATITRSTFDSPAWSGHLPLRLINDNLKLLAIQ